MVKNTDQFAGGIDYSLILNMKLSLLGLTDIIFNTAVMIIMGTSSQNLSRQRNFIDSNPVVFPNAGEAKRKLSGNTADLIEDTVERITYVLSEIQMGDNHVNFLLLKNWLDLSLREDPGKAKKAMQIIIGTSPVPADAEAFIDENFADFFAIEDFKSKILSGPERISNPDQRILYIQM